MQNAENLRVYSVAMQLAKETYRTTAKFPRDERFGLTSQMRRAAVSVGSNIAEGCGRDGDRELCAFLHYSLGSASELEFQLALAQELEFLESTQAESLTVLIVDAKRMLSRLAKNLRATDPKRSRRSA